jgi:hypothetical protein
MNEQNYKNHSRIVPVWHILLPFLFLVILGFAIVNFLHSDMDASAIHWHLPIMLLPVAILIQWGFSRRFALYAQDRAIRAEEGLRHFILTGKQLDTKLNLGQIIALRFASDAEFPALAKRAVEENLSPKDIKQAIVRWRADHYRV